MSARLRATGDKANGGGEGDRDAVHGIAVNGGEKWRLQAAAGTRSYLAIVGFAAALEVTAVEDLNVLKDVLLLDDAHLQGKW